MVGQRRHHGIAGWARFFCVLSLVLVGFAHRPVAVASPAAAELSAYALPDGSLPSFCLPGDGSDGKSGARSGHCEFCRIAAGAMLPSPLAVADTMFVLVGQAHPPAADDRPASRVFAPGTPPRGPPLLNA
ncbi:hypothetical protein DFR52_102706 [Hoeflea marina]|uniref:DUF2946 family protein n=1 Tax=Hoeflea marina TaxID=274592 RepID=A0A317PP58_9HYPH|nr:hypothetical protein [Hoeflea marina]PWW02041.1 hypothetical protein DFR52_102706 [Hoeflea marina]